MPASLRPHWKCTGHLSMCICPQRSQQAWTKTDWERWLPPAAASWLRMFLFSSLNLKHLLQLLSFTRVVTWAEPGHKCMSTFYWGLLNDSYCMLSLNIQTISESMTPENTYRATFHQLRPAQSDPETCYLYVWLFLRSQSTISHHYHISKWIILAFCWDKWYNYNNLGQQGTTRGRERNGLTQI